MNRFCWTNKFLPRAAIKIGIRIKIKAVIIRTEFKHNIKLKVQTLSCTST